MTVEVPRGRRVLARSDFPLFLRAIQGAGYRVVGPTVRDGAIVYGDIRDETDLPIGWTDRQDAGTYRLERRKDAALFGYNVGPHSWKKYLYPSHERLWTAKAGRGTFTVTTEPTTGPPLAFLGMRACELAAVAIQDRVFDGVVHDVGYHARRSTALRIAVQCGQAAPTCFCVSMATGPAATIGYDLALTELLSAGRHEFVVEIGTKKGAEIIVADLPVRNEIGVSFYAKSGFRRLTESFAQMPQ